MSDETTVPVAAGLCRRCVRTLSRHIRDVAGVVSLRIEPAIGRLSVRGDVDPAAVMAARDSAGFGVSDGAN